ncbi:MAG: PAS domain S-box protein [Candidatus Omnitrophica bacterium]|nr:PAS domain S-box protein [Candidatus Omnitrophota bacterium]
MKSNGKRRLFSFLYTAGIVLFLVAAAGGYFLTLFLQGYAKGDVMEGGKAAVTIISSLAEGELEIAQRAVASMSRSPSIVEMVRSQDPAGIEDASRVLDRYNAAMGGTVAYIMDTEGTTIASSNRGAPDSFVGKNYAFRPYFREAMEGKLGEYFALGVTSGKRGYYASYPVYSSREEIGAVAVIKKELDFLEEEIGHYPFCFMVSPEGLIFLSSRRDMLFKALWKIDPQVEARLLASRQFGKGPFRPVFLEQQLRSGDRVKFNENLFFVSRAFLGRRGWSIVKLNPAGLVVQFRYFGIVSTLLLVFLIAGGLFFLFRMDTAFRLISQSEDKFHRLSDAAFEGIIVHKNGRIIDTNRQFAEMVGYDPGEIIGRNVFDFIDGKDEELLLRNTHSNFEKRYEITGKRKDGTFFPMEICGKTLEYDGQTLRVVSIQDITERKRSRERLAAQRELLDRSNKELEVKVEELEEALSHIKRLEGLVPICVSCKKMRLEGNDPKDERSWVRLEEYISRSTDADLTHGLCPECAKKMQDDIRKIKD